MDLFEKIGARAGTQLAQISRQVHGKAAFPKLTGEIGPRMIFNGREHLVWSINNYLGLANHPEVRRVDAESAARYGLASPMGSRMMSGETEELELLEAELAEYARKQDAFFLNFGYPGMVSLIDQMLTRHDWLVYDAESHACIMDGVRLHQGRSKQRTKSFPHNNIAKLEQVLENISKVRGPDEGVLVVTEGVFGMSGVQGRLKEIVALKQKYGFRLLIDDAHGFGVLGPNGGGTGEEQGVQDDIDLYFATFAKSGASVGAFVASRHDIIWQLRYGMRSQIFSKGLPMPIVVGNRERLRLMRTEPWRREQCLKVAKVLRENLRANGFEVGNPNSAITPVFLKLDHDLTQRLVYWLRNHHGVFCSVVIYPVVPPGIVQLRLIATADHTVEDAQTAVNAITNALWEVNADRDLVGMAAAGR
ncbi:MAG TPA: aminotransferase class I/II-fold pyridoxal phosphate-dependent enzyme [Candidatus Limnocylindrales bacterium]|nr:aminotransferase class I/II-fold pyridoxal phosphate-dependent enzyme [Candidatus Limnocylindrales bacterium]